MRQTAGMRLALYLAAALTTATTLRSTADEPGPQPAITPTATSKTPKRSDNVESQAKGTKRETYPFRGVIASIDANLRKVTLESKQIPRVILLTEVTRMERDGQRIELDQLKQGETVGGTLRKNSGGFEEAVLIRVGVRSEDDKSPGAVKENKQKAKDE